jgi:DNA-binding CsgD family transcriptional regulator
MEGLRLGQAFVMEEAEELSLLIGDIYDASLDTALWPAVFEKSSKYLRGFSCLHSRDLVEKTSQIHFQSGYDPHFLNLYVEKYGKTNPLFPTATFFEIERMLSIPDCLPFKEFRETQFAREWALPQGLIDLVFCNLEKSPTSSHLFSVMRHVRDGRVDDDVRRKFALVVPHLRRALLISQVIERHKVEAAALADTLDTLASGMFLVDATARIVHVNASGYAMLDQANVLRAPSGRLGANDPAADQALLDVFTSAASGDSHLGRKGIAVPLEGRNGERYVAHVLPLTSGKRRGAGVSYAAVAAVFVRKAGLDLPPPPVVIAQQFQLTPAELRVLFCVVEISGLAEVADVLGLSEATVRTHLRHIFEKTETHRQADLVKLVAGYCVPP